jgi:hypothetical protein
MLDIVRIGVAVRVTLICNNCGGNTSFEAPHYNKAMAQIRDMNSWYIDNNYDYFLCPHCRFTLLLTDWIPGLKLKVDRYVTYRTQA